VEELWVMMTAVVIAIALMIWASKPLTRFVNAHPTVVVLCLGFLLMIGFSLIAEGFGMQIPKGYLYAAIGFSVMVEFFNQMARFNRAKAAMRRPLRERTADAVLRMLGGRSNVDSNAPLNTITAGADMVFAPIERQMIRRVLELSQRRVESVMTPRPDIVWLDLEDDESTLIEALKGAPHTRMLVARGDLDALEGVVQSRDLLRICLGGRKADIPSVMMQPLVIHEGMSAMQVLEQLRTQPVPLAVVVDEYGSIEGVVTVADILAAIAGDFRDTADEHGGPVSVAEDSWLLPGTLPLTDLARLLRVRDASTREYHTVAGLALDQLGRIPQVGTRFTWQGGVFEIQGMDGRRVDRLLVAKSPEAAEAQG
ncbi:MAG: hemolysin family protein, partial [Woeseiaceae bacterium]